MTNSREIDSLTWTALASATPYATPFHDARFTRMATDILGGDLSMYHSVDADDIEWLTPVFTSYPWAASDRCATSAIGYGGPLPLSREFGGHRALQSVARSVGETVGRAISRGQLSPLLPAAEHGDGTTTSVVPLKPDVDRLFATVVTGNARTAVRKASGHALHHSRARSVEELSEACALIQATQTDVGSTYVTPEVFVRRLASEHPDFCEVRTTKLHETMIAAAVLLHHPSYCCHWLHGWRREFAEVCANQALMWVMIESCARSGAAWFDMGTSHTPAISKAKSRWGARTVPVGSVLESVHG